MTFLIGQKSVGQKSICGSMLIKYYIGNLRVYTTALTNVFVFRKSIVGKLYIGN